jgi:preprotein translocase subunit SecF
LSRTILTSGTTLLVIITLYFLGGGVIHDFALAMLIGVGVGTYSSIFVASPILLMLGVDVPAEEPAQDTP